MQVVTETEQAIGQHHIERGLFVGALQVALAQLVVNVLDLLEVIVRGIEAVEVSILDGR